MYICEIQYAPYADSNNKTFKIVYGTYKRNWGRADREAIIKTHLFLALLVIFDDYFGIVLLNYFTT